MYCNGCGQFLDPEMPPGLSTGHCPTVWAASFPDELNINGGKSLSTRKDSKLKVRWAAFLGRLNGKRKLSGDTNDRVRCCTSLSLCLWLIHWQEQPAIARETLQPRPFSTSVPQQNWEDKEAGHLSLYIIPLGAQLNSPSLPPILQSDATLPFTAVNAEEEKRMLHNWAVFDAPEQR
ncbi:hypothetical protein BGW80DRAFT_264400 [Lactifluus volemus]|nr:hypothetical protein BGW80DRAFT_264400 [Lactifluus volemus]